MVTPPGLQVPVYEEKDIDLAETNTKSIIGLWRVGSRSSWSDESDGLPKASNLKLRTEKGAVDAHVVVTSFARDGRPSVDVSSTTGPLTIKMVCPHAAVTANDTDRALNPLDQNGELPFRPARAVQLGNCHCLPAYRFPWSNRELPRLVPLFNPTSAAQHQPDDHDLSVSASTSNTHSICRCTDQGIWQPFLPLQPVFGA
jgi:hypothetical protein